MIERLLIEVIQDLLNCPDLNHDSLEDESIKIIQEAQEIIETLTGEPA